LDQAAPLGLQLARSSCQLATDLVTDFGQAFAGGQDGDGHRRGRLGGQGREKADHTPVPPRKKRAAARPCTRTSAPLGLESPHVEPARPHLIPAANALRAIGWPWVGAPGPGPWADAMAAHPQARPARVVEQHRSGYVVADAIDRACTVESPPQWQRPPGYRRGKVAPEDRAVVGDWVLVEGGLIVALLPRRSAIKRGAAGEHYRQQLIAAN